MRTERTSSKVDSWGLIKLVFSTVTSRRLPGERYGKLMEQPGWHFTALTCEDHAITGSLSNAKVFPRLSIALELAKHNPVYEDIASQFFEVRH